MCTLVIAWRVLADAPVAVAANRDESIDRPSSPPRSRGEEPRIVAPRDERAGGTWIGYNDAGVFAGISNRWVDRELAAERSRGHLVLDALGCRDAEAATTAVQQALRTTEYDAFNLLVADSEAAILLEWEGALEVTDLDAGIHVVMNAGFDDHFRSVEGRSAAVRRQQASARDVRDALQVDADESATSWQGRAEAVLGDHDFGVCIHGDGFGTRSASTISLRSDGTVVYRYADGPPCETSFEPVEGQS